MLPTQASQAPTSPSRSPLALGMAFFALLAIASIVGSVLLYRSTKRFLAASITGTGTVIRMDMEENIERNEGKTIVKKMYYPVISFTPESATSSVQFRGGGTSNSVEYTAGESVALRYEASAPKKARIDQFSSIWGLPITLGIFGSILLAGVVFMWVLFTRDEYSANTK